MKFARAVIVLSYFGLGYLAHQAHADGKKYTTKPIKPFTLTGTIRWPKALGHPKLPNLVAIGGSAPTACDGFAISAMHLVKEDYVPDPSKSWLPITDTGHTAGFVLSCRPEADDATNYNLRYEIGFPRSHFHQLSHSGNCEYVSVTVTTNRRAWSPGPGNPEGQLPQFSSEDAASDCNYPERALDKKRQPGQRFDDGTPGISIGINNFVGRLP